MRLLICATARAEFDFSKKLDRIELVEPGRYFFSGCKSERGISDLYAYNYFKISIFDSSIPPTFGDAYITVVIERRAECDLSLRNSERYCRVRL